MKKAVGYILVSAISLGIGIGVGYKIRKKTGEVQFEEITEEELEKLQAEMAQKEEPPQQEAQKPFPRPNDIQKIIDRQFERTTESEKSFPASHPDTQKELYYKKWKAEETAEKYDTRTKEEPEDPVVNESEDDLENGFDQEFLKSVSEVLPDIEPGSMEDWNRWETQVPDIENGYSCETVYWFEEDDILTDEDGSELAAPVKYLGCDPETQFKEISAETTGDDDIRVIIDNRHKVIYQIVRKHGSFDRKKRMEELGNDFDEEDERR